MGWDLSATMVGSYSDQETALAKIGLLSDSHGRASTTQAAVTALIELGADRLIHLGDIGSHEVIDALVAPPLTPPLAPPQSNAQSHENVTGQASGSAVSQIPCHLVFGNVDWDHDSLARYASQLDLSVDHPVGRLTIDGRTLVFMHGHDTQAFDQALADQPTWLMHGHSHQMVDRMHGNTRIINPGALFRARSYTVALLNTADDSLHFHTVSTS